MYKLNLILISIFAVLVTGCGQFNSNKQKGAAALSMTRKPFGTCDRKSVVSTNLCMEATGTDYNEPGYLGILQSSCESSGGTFSTNNCDQTNSFGVCVVAPGQTNEAYISYYGPQYDAMTAQSACESTGNGAVWVPN
jgi:hypothetical protein